MSTCTESKLPELAARIAALLKPGDRVILEGPLGAGKTTLARHLLESLGVTQETEGSPTFAIAHEYVGKMPSGKIDVIHLDLYRIKSEGEIDDAGIPSYFWERNAVVITEWLSLWPEFEAAVLKGPARFIKIQIDPEERMGGEQDARLRKRIYRISNHLKR